MPLTALFKGEDLDATSLEDATWTAIHCRKPPVKVQCRGCGSSMHAVRSKLGLRFFSHDRVTPGCPSMGETAEHLNLKSQLVLAIRSCGWTSQLEAVPRVDDRGGWRADVLATNPESGARIAFEAQLASMTVAEGEERTAKYAADNIATIWVTTAKAVWLWVLPGLRLRARSFDGDNDVKDGDSGNDVATGAATMDIIDGVAAFREHSLGNPEGATSDVEVIRRWEQLADATLDATVSAILGGTMVVHRVTWLNEQTPFAGKSDEDMHVNALVSKSDVRAESQYSGSEGLYEVVRKRRRALARASRTPRPVGPVAPVPARRSKNTNPMGERQERVLRSALPEVLALAMSGEHVWVGVPPMPLTNGGAAGGDASSAYGLPLWIGTEVDEARLVAVLSPVARLITDEVAHRWLDECVRVYVESEVEGSVLSRALGWPMGDLYLRHSKAL